MQIGPRISEDLPLVEDAISLRFEIDRPPQHSAPHDKTKGCQSDRRKTCPALGHPREPCVSSRGSDHSTTPSQAMAKLDPAEAAINRS